MQFWSIDEDNALGFCGDEEFRDQEPTFVVSHVDKIFSWSESLRLQQQIGKALVENFLQKIIGALKLRNDGDAIYGSSANQPFEIFGQPRIIVTFHVKADAIIAFMGNR